MGGSDKGSLAQRALEKFREARTSRTADIAKVKTVCGEIHIPLQRPWTSSAIKKELCKSVDICPRDIRLIAGGKELIDDEIVSPYVYALTRTDASSHVNATLVVSNDKKRATMEGVRFSCSLKIFQLRRQLSRMTKISENGMRLIIGARALRDENLLGDYVLISQKRRNTKPNAEVTIYVNNPIDLRKDVDVRFHLIGGKVLKSYFDLKTPITRLREIIRNQ